MHLLCRVREHQRPVLSHTGELSSHYCTILIVPQWKLNCYAAVENWSGTGVCAHVEYVVCVLCMGFCRFDTLAFWRVDTYIY